jgi:GxxExxY protein
VTENEIGEIVIGAAIKVHSAVGPGLLESVYESCLACELDKRGARTRKQVILPLCYEGLMVDNGYSIELLVEGRVVVELKAVAAILPVHRGQLLSYLRLGGFKLGYLLNFLVSHMLDGGHQDGKRIRSVCVLSALLSALCGKTLG